MAVNQTLTLTQVSQSVADNSSRVRILWRSTQTGESYNGYTKTATYEVTAPGYELRDDVSYTLPKGTTKTILDRTLTIRHKADGTATVRVTTNMNTGISAGVIKLDKSLTLDRIPRATTPTLSASSVYMGDKLTISLPRASSSFTHKLEYKFAGSGWVAITSNAGTSYTWTVPTSLANSLPISRSGQVTLRVTTMQGSTSIGAKTLYFTAKVPADLVPTISTLTVTETDAEVLNSGVGRYIYGKSDIKITASASGVAGSDIVYYELTYGGKKYEDIYKSTATWNIKPPAVGTDIKISVRAVDSRGSKSAAKTVTIDVYRYNRPAVSVLRAYRVNAAKEPADDGTQAVVEYAYSVTSLDGQNTANAVLSFAQSGASTFTTIRTSTATSESRTHEVGVVYFSTDYEYDFRLVVKDIFGETYQTEVHTALPSGAVILDIKADGKGIALGKTAEFPGIDFGWDIVDQVLATGSLSGRYKTHDGWLIQWGNVSITPTTADTPQVAIVNFPLAYESTPSVLVCPVSSVPQRLSVGTLRTHEDLTDNTKAAAVVLTRDSLTSTGITWLAIGKGASGT